MPIYTPCTNLELCVIYNYIYRQLNKMIKTKISLTPDVYWCMHHQWLDLLN